MKKYQELFFILSSILLATKLQATMIMPNARDISCLSKIAIQLQITSLQFKETAKLILIFSLAFFMGSIGFAQTLEPVKIIDPTASAALEDSLLLELSDMPELTKLNGVNAEAPRYSYLWIFGDGNFLNGSPDSILSHRYEVPAVPSPQDVFEAKVYATGLYGDDGNPPPKIINSNDIKPAFDPAFQGKPHEKTQAVQQGYLRLQKNHVNLIPGDTTAWILSIKNNLDDDFSLNGQIYLFYDGLIEKLFVNPKSGDSTYVNSVIGGTTQYGEFRHDTTLFYFDGIPNFTFYQNNIPDAQLSQNYKKAVFWNYTDLQPGEERHLFIQFRDDPNLLDKFSSKEEGTTRFLAMMTAQTIFDTQGPNFDLTTDDVERVSKLGLNGFLDNAQEWIFDTISFPGTPSNFIFGDQIADLYEVNSSLKRSHDPNHLKIKGCACPPGSDGAQKLLTSIDFSNDGKASTKNVYVSMEIPAEIQFNSMLDTLLSLHPPLDPTSSGSVVIERSSDNATRTVTWKLLNFQIDPVVEYGVGHPATYGQIVFTMLTQPGVNLDDIPEMQACIRFDEIDGEAVCTVPVKPVALTAASEGAPDLQEILECEECTSPNPGFHLPIPLWLCILLLIILVLIIWIMLSKK